MIIIWISIAWRYLLSKPEDWLSTRIVIVKGIEDESKMEIVLSVDHNMNTQENLLSVNSICV